MNTPWLINTVSYPLIMELATSGMQTANLTSVLFILANLETSKVGRILKTRRGGGGLAGSPLPEKLVSQTVFSAF